MKRFSFLFFRAFRLVRLTAFLLVGFSVFAAPAAADNEAAAFSPASAREQIAELRREIARHDELYHRKATPEISDAAYDQLKRRLGELEKAFPAEASQVAALPEIGDDRTGLFQTYRHRERMMSLEKAYSDAELRAFHARLAKALGRDELAYVVEPKIDGLAVSVTYENGKLVRAVTRGNGIEGDDITANARQIRGLPRELQTTDSAGRSLAVPRMIELRGEIYVSFSDFAEINAEREAAGEARFANPRNLAAGTIRQLDPVDVARRNLRIVFFGMGASEPRDALPSTQFAFHAALEAWGLPALPHDQRRIAIGPDELVRAVEAWNRARSGFEFPTDGAVVKLDSIALQRAAGTSETAPRWAVAYKFPPERAETQVLAITLQVGRTGVLTPVAELAPIQLAGSTVARATLHNRDEIARKDVRVGDFIYLEKAGDIIPAIVGVNLARRPPTAQPYVFPSICSECRSAIATRESEVALRCANSGCPAQRRRRIEHFASKACVAIEGLGPAMIETLVAQGWVKDIPDLYRLRRADLLTLGRDVGRSTERLLVAIEASKRAELWRFIHGLGIPQVGAATAKELARQLGSLEKLAALPAEAGAASTPPLRAAAVFLGEPRHRAVVAELLAAGVRPTPPPVATVRLAGKNFVLTGTLPTLSRAQATEKIESAGGKVSNAVSRNTHYVIAGSEPGAKMEQARTLGVTVLDEAGLLRLLAEE